MSRTDPPKPKLDLTFYPAYCYSASPTWSKWVKLTCWDVHYALRTHQQQGKSYTSGSAASQTLFYLNHPIQYVQLVGIVVAIEDYYEHHFLITLDDSSGATVDVALRKPRPRHHHNAHNATLTRPPTAVAANNPKANALRNPDNDESNSETDDEDTKATLTLLTHLSTLTLGTSILAKGSISLFRSSRQLSLLRLQSLPSTTAELSHIASRTAFLNSTLGKPWVLSSNRQRKLREAAESDRVKMSGRQKKERERLVEQKAWESRREERLRERWETEEEVRRELAEVARRDGERVMARRSERAARRAAQKDQLVGLEAEEVVAGGSVKVKGKGKGKGSV